VQQPFVTLLHFSACPALIAAAPLVRLCANDAQCTRLADNKSTGNGSNDEGQKEREDVDDATKQIKISVLLTQN
jgi:hypothetical protein